MSSLNIVMVQTHAADIWMLVMFILETSIGGANAAIGKGRETAGKTDRHWYCFLSLSPTPTSASQMHVPTA